MTLDELFPYINLRRVKGKLLRDLINDLSRQDTGTDRATLLPVMYGIDDADDLKNERTRAEIKRVNAQTRREIASARRLDREE